MIIIIMILIHTLFYSVCRTLKWFNVLTLLHIFSVKPCQCKQVQFCYIQTRYIHKDHSTENHNFQICTIWVSKSLHQTCTDRTKQSSMHGHCSHPALYTDLVHNIKMIAIVVLLVIICTRNHMINVNKYQVHYPDKVLHNYNYIYFFSNYWYIIQI